MPVYRFTVEWSHLLEVDASSEEEAWDLSHDEAVNAFSKSKGDLRIDIEEDNDSSEEDSWGRFDTDPEEITFITLDPDNDY